MTTVTLIGGPKEWAGRTVVVRSDTVPFIFEPAAGVRYNVERIMLRSTWAIDVAVYEGMTIKDAMLEVLDAYMAATAWRKWMTAAQPVIDQDIASEADTC